jgi:hypothetical protein
VLKGHRRLQLVAAIDDFATERTSPQEAPAEELLRQERHRAVRDGLAELKPEQRELLLLLHAEPPLSYQELRRRLGIPTGSIGPTPARCLAKLRQTPRSGCWRPVDVRGLLLGPGRDDADRRRSKDRRCPLADFSAYFAIAHFDGATEG